MEFFRSHILLVPLAAFLASVVSKSAYLLSRRRFSVAAALGTGGMPSVHSAIVTSITAAVGIKAGWSSETFAACVVFAAIIVYDAMHVRYEAGLHAKAINRMADTEFNESIGHLPREALVGSLLGVAMAFALVCPR